MPQILTLLTLTLVHAWYEEYTPPPPDKGVEIKHKIQHMPSHSTRCALNVAHMDLHGCTKELLFVPKGHKIYIRYWYSLFWLCKYTSELFI